MKELNLSRDAPRFLLSAAQVKHVPLRENNEPTFGLGK
jgi:hypothetical protein